MLIPVRRVEQLAGCSVLGCPAVNPDTFNNHVRYLLLKIKYDIGLTMVFVALM